MSKRNYKNASNGAKDEEASTSQSTERKDSEQKTRNGNNRKANPRRGGRSGNRRSNDSSGGKSASNFSTTITNWVNRNPDQVNATGNISFLNATGSPLDLFDWRGGYGDPLEERTGVPGIMRMGYIPTFGAPQGGNDAVNIAMARLYAYLREYNSGSRNYFAPDLFKYFLQMDSGYTILAFLIRVYGIVNAFSPINVYTPRAILASMNVDYDSIVRNLPNLYAQITRMASKLNSFTVPNMIPAFQQHFEMTSKIYVDAPSGYAHMYIFVPEGYYRMVEGDAKPMSNKKYFDLELVKFRTDPFDGAGGQYSINGITQAQGALTFNDLVGISEDVVNYLYQDPDVLIMSGDVRKCTGDWFVAPTIPQDYRIDLTYDDGMLIRILNANAIGKLPLLTSRLGGQDIIATLTEDYAAGVLVFGSTYTRDAYGAVTMKPLQGYPTPFVTDDPTKLGPLVARLNNSNIIMNMVQDDPTPLDVIATATGMGVYEYAIASDSDTIVRNLFSCSIDLFTKFSITYTYYDNVGMEPTFKVTPYFTDFYAIATYAPFVHHVHLLETFASHPAIYPIDFAGPHAGKVHYPLTQLIRPAIITGYNLSNMHRTANLSYFDISSDAFSRNK